MLDPLYHAATAKKTGKEFTEVWAQDGLQKNFDLAKEMLMLVTQIAHPDPSTPLSLRTDASKVAIGAHLEQDGQREMETLRVLVEETKAQPAKLVNF